MGTIELCSSPQGVLSIPQTASNSPFRIDDIWLELNGLLPLELVSFTAATNEKNTIVSWRANSENERELFVLEKAMTQLSSCL